MPPRFPTRALSPCDCYWTHRQPRGHGRTRLVRRRCTSLSSSETVKGYMYTKTRDQWTCPHCTFYNEVMPRSSGGHHFQDYRPSSSLEPLTKLCNATPSSARTTSSSWCARRAATSERSTSAAPSSARRAPGRTGPSSKRRTFDGVLKLAPTRGHAHFPVFPMVCHAPWRFVLASFSLNSPPCDDDDELNINHPAKGPAPLERTFLLVVCCTCLLLVGLATPPAVGPYFRRNLVWCGYGRD